MGYVRCLVASLLALALGNGAFVFSVATLFGTSYRDMTGDIALSVAGNMVIGLVVAALGLVTAGSLKSGGIPSRAALSVIMFTAGLSLVLWPGPLAGLGALWGFVFGPGAQFLQWSAELAGGLIARILVPNVGIGWLLAILGILVDLPEKPTKPSELAKSENAANKN